MTVNRYFGEYNPYYNPKECGLELIDCVDRSSGCYEFDYLAVWRDLATGHYYYATDSGCSCPEPFEVLHSLADLTYFSLDNLPAIEAEFWSWWKRNGEDWIPEGDKKDLENLIDVLRAS